MNADGPIADTIDDVWLIWRSRVLAEISRVLREESHQLIAMSCRLEDDLEWRQPDSTVRRAERSAFA
jgi:hypothetical protein